MNTEIKQKKSERKPMEKRFTLNIQHWQLTRSRTIRETLIKPSDQARVGMVGGMKYEVNLLTIRNDSHSNPAGPCQLFFFNVFFAKLPFQVGNFTTKNINAIKKLTFNFHLMMKIQNLEISIKWKRDENKVDFLSV